MFIQNTILRAPRPRSPPEILGWAPQSLTPNGYIPAKRASPSRRGFRRGDPRQHRSPLNQQMWEYFIGQPFLGDELRARPHAYT